MWLPYLLSYLTYLLATYLTYHFYLPMATYLTYRLYLPMATLPTVLPYLPIDHLPYLSPLPTYGHLPFLPYLHMATYLSYLTYLWLPYLLSYLPPYIWLPITTSVPTVLSRATVRSEGSMLQFATVRPLCSTGACETYLKRHLRCIHSSISTSLSFLFCYSLLLGSFSLLLFFAVGVLFSSAVLCCWGPFLFCCSLLPCLTLLHEEPSVA